MPGKSYAAGLCSGTIIVVRGEHREAPARTADELRSRLADGDLLNEHARRVVVTQETLILARVPFRGRADLFEDLDTTERHFRQDPMQVSPKMLLKLVPDDSNAVKVEARTPEEQGIPNSGYAYWIWAVRPLKPGERELALMCYAVARIGQREAPVYLLTKTSKVVVNPQSTLQSLANRSKSFGEKALEEIPKQLVTVLWAGVGAAAVWL